MSVCVCLGGRGGGGRPRNCNVKKKQNKKCCRFYIVPAPTAWSVTDSCLHRD